MCCFGYSTGFCSAERRRAGSRKYKRQVRKDNDKEKTQKRRSASDRQKASKAGNCIDNPGAAVTGPVSGTLYFVRGRAGGNAGIWIGIWGVVLAVINIWGFVLGMISLKLENIRQLFPSLGVIINGIDGSYVSGDLYYWNGMICNYEKNINTIKNDSVSLWGQDYFCILLG